MSIPSHVFCQNALKKTYRLPAMSPSWNVKILSRGRKCYAKPVHFNILACKTWTELAKFLHCRHKQIEQIRTFCSYVFEWTMFENLHPLHSLICIFYVFGCSVLGFITEGHNSAMSNFCTRDLTEKLITEPNLFLIKICQLTVMGMFFWQQNWLQSRIYFF